MDVMFVQEKHSDERTESDWDREWEGQVVLHGHHLQGL